MLCSFWRSKIELPTSVKCLQVFSSVLMAKHFHMERERERELTFQNEVLNFLFSEAKSFKLFLIAIQGWVGGIVYKTLA